ncbi:MAG TPA: tripartite tricarboxylate transporter substrate-binding protein [Segeticoccus sp.]|uniref:Bug family tripartite tricarboxylate transporter substrate binding protein n=1 Tax=Segeticoccus sp. TaxID=2706531 RepID=UPI002D7ED528|nr:tripartite tricarboxylate transporter substrate-binding protein [Segeticoccus sp.]HET8598755.1 tripartite tricarboxylate transporter substrate-binding protein [Segeticoccus sp.]
MKQLMKLSVAALAALSLGSVAACGTTADAKSSGGGTGTAAAASDPTDLRIMVPNTPGGGYDTTARISAKVLDQEGISRNVEVYNVAGAGGTVGLAKLVNNKGDGKQTMLMGLGVVGSQFTNKSKATLNDTTPIARLIEEAGAVVVSKDSPYKTLPQLIKAWKANPSKVTVGGGSSPGGPDHLLPMELAKTVGIDPTKVNYVTYDGGGDLLPAILGNKLGFAVSGYGEFLSEIKNGDVRVLGVSSAERVPVVDAPTFKEQGVNLTFTNWRGLVAPPGIDDADKQMWVDAITKMHDSAGWKKELKTNGWTDAFLTGQKFDTFMNQQSTRVEDTLTELGLAG